MAQRDEKNIRRADEEDFSDITEFRPERAVFTGKRPAPIKEEAVVSEPKPWIVALILGIALLVATGGLVMFSLRLKNQHNNSDSSSSLVPQSHIDVSTESGKESETEPSSVTINEKTKAPTSSGETETEAGVTENPEPEEPTETEPTQTEAPEPETTVTTAPPNDEALVEGVLYMIRDGEADILRCTEPAAAMVIPETVCDKPVEGVDDEAFAGCTQIISLTFPDSLCWIGANAFNGCSALEEVILGKNVNAISEEAFSGTENVTIVAPAGSYAEEYAARKGMTFRSLN